MNGAQCGISRGFSKHCMNNYPGVNAGVTSALAWIVKETKNPNNDINQTNRSVKLQHHKLIYILLYLNLN